MRTSTLRILPAILAFAMSVTMHAQPAPSPTSTELDTYFGVQLTRKNSPAISVAVVKDGKVMYAKGFGFADLENEVPATPETVYRIGSITKQFTATMVMQLVQEGKVKLDDPISKILSDTPKTWEKVTVRNLLNHTSGIKSYTEIPGLFNDAAMKPTTPAGIIKTVEKDKLDFEPGTKWHYDNTGYELLGMIVEKLDGRSYAKSLQSRILDPLGMTNTYFVSESTLIKHRAQGYSKNKDGFKHAPYLNMDWPYAAGSIESTVLDLAKWDAALYGDKILPQSALKEMWTPTKLADGKTEPYGFGWQMGQVKDTPTVEHGGGIHGFTTHIRRAPMMGLTVIVLTNSDSGSDPAGLTKDAMGIFEPSLKDAAPKGVVDTDPKATAYAKKILQSLIDGKLDRKIFTHEFDDLLSDEMIKGAHDQFAQVGALKSFELVEVSSKLDLPVRTYQVVFEKFELKMDVMINDQGLIAGLNMHQ